MQLTYTKTYNHKTYLYYNYILMIRIRSFDEVTVNFSSKVVKSSVIVKFALFTLTSKYSH
jgi:hypothetical protein